MSIETQDIVKLCDLARLEIGADEQADLTAKLSQIVAMVDQLQAVDVGATEPMAHPVPQAQRLRPDSVSTDIDRDLYQQNAARTEAGLYLVPRVIE